jgi:hypothetical protein
MVAGIGRSTSTSTATLRADVPGPPPGVVPIQQSRCSGEKTPHVVAAAALTS